jgi:hypothetical protein
MKKTVYLLVVGLLFVVSGGCTAVRVSNGPFSAARYSFLQDFEARSIKVKCPSNGVPEVSIGHINDEVSAQTKAIAEAVTKSVIDALVTKGVVAK